MGGLFLYAVVDDIRVNGFDLPSSVDQEVVEFFILGVVVIDHVYLAEIELGQFCALGVLVKAAETKPFQVDPLDVLGKSHRDIQTGQILSAVVSFLDSFGSLGLQFQEIYLFDCFESID